MLGVPFNIASYALLLQMTAAITNTVPGEFVHTYGDLHIYNNHMDAVREQLAREPLPLPQVEIDVQSACNRALDGATYLHHFRDHDIKLTNYVPHGPIKAPIAV